MGSMVWAWLRAGKTRGALTFACLFVVFLLYGVLDSVSRAFEVGPETTEAEVLMVMPKYSLMDALPVAYKERIRGIAGVAHVSEQTWLGGSYLDVGNTFPQWAVSPAEFLAIQDGIELSAESRAAFESGRYAAIVGQETAERFGWEPGQRIVLMPGTWTNDDGGGWEFEVAGVFQSTAESVDTSAMYLNFAYFDEYRQWGGGGTGYYVVGLLPGARASSVASEIDGLFANSSAETKTATETQYRQMWATQVGDIGLIVSAVMSAVFFTLVFLTCTGMSQTIRERRKDLAVLKCVGFKGRLLAGLVMAESALLVLPAGALGLLAAAAAMPVLNDATATFVGTPKLSMDTVAKGVLIALSLSVVVGLQPAVRSAKAGIAQELAAD